MKKWNYKAIVLAIMLGLVVLIAAVVLFFSFSKSEPAFNVSVCIHDVYIDLLVDEKMEVVDAIVTGESANEILSGAKIKKVRLKTSVEEIITKMKESEFIDKSGDDLFICIYDETDKNRMLSVEMEVARTIEKIIPSDYDNLNVHSYVTSEDEPSIIKLAEENTLPIAKARLIDLILKKQGKKTKADLISLDISKLFDIIHDNEIDSPKIICFEVNPEKRLSNIKNREYISSDAAVKVALDKLDISESDAYRISLKNDIDDNQPVYNVELVYGDRKYQFLISAVAGVIIDIDTKSAEYFVDGDDIREINFKELKNSIEPVIGSDAAYLLALKYLNLSKGNSILEEIEFEKINNTLVYSVTVSADNQENNILIDAYTGDFVEAREDDGSETVIEDSSMAIDVALQSQDLRVTDVDVKSVKFDPETESYVVIFSKGEDLYTVVLDKNTSNVISSDKSLNKDALLSEQEILDIALKDSSLLEEEIEIIKNEYDYSSGDYDLVFKHKKVEYEYKINGMTGEIASFVKNVEEDIADKEDLKKNYISKEDAVNFVIVGAQFVAEKVDVKSTSLDEEKGIYTVRLEASGTSYSYEVDAITGEIKKTSEKPAGKVNENEDNSDKPDQDTDSESSDKKDDADKKENTDKKDDAKNNDDEKDNESDEEVEVISIASPETALSVVLLDLGVTEDEILLEGVNYQPKTKEYVVKLAAYDLNYAYVVDAVTLKIVKKEEK